MIFKINVTAPVYQEILEHFMLPSADKLFKDPDFILQHDLVPAHTAKVFLFGSQRRWSLSLLVLTLIFPALLPCLVRVSFCTALQTKILWINRSLNAIDTIETWVSGNLTALTERSQPAIRWTRGRGGESCVWRLFPWRTLISTFSEP